MIASKGKWIPVSWPHDGLQHDKGSGEELAAQYKKLGTNMMKAKATHPPKADQGEKEGEGGNSVEAGLIEMMLRMQTGRLKVASHLEDWFQEFRMFHRKDGKLVKVDDDLISATRYLIMMLRHATVEKSVQEPNYYPSFEVMDSEIGI